MSEQTTIGPRIHSRITITKNTKGYSYETSCSVDGDNRLDVTRELAELIRQTDWLARDEISIREALDAAGQGATSDPS